MNSAMTRLAIFKTHDSFLHPKLYGECSYSKSFTNKQQSCASTCSWETIARYIFKKKENTKRPVVQGLAQKLRNGSILTARGRALHILSTSTSHTTSLGIRVPNSRHREQSFDWRSRSFLLTEWRRTSWRPLRLDSTKWKCGRTHIFRQSKTRWVSLLKKLYNFTSPGQLYLRT